MEDHSVREIDKKKRSLKRYKKNLDCIRRLENKLSILEERLVSVKSPTLSGMPRGGKPITADDLIADKIDLKKRIDRLKSKSDKLKSEILEEIDSLEDYRYCEILEAFFIDCLSLEEIADNEGYTVRHVYRLYQEAVTELAVKRQ